MADKSLKEKAILIQGKKYVLVADRVLFFNENYPTGSITTELVSKPEDDTVVIKATVTPVVGENRLFTGYSQATWGEGYINKTSALENAETSAVGRALAFMGIGVIENIASIDEIHKAGSTPGRQKKIEPPTTPAEARKNAEEAIGLSKNLDELMAVGQNINKSKILTAKDKEELSFRADEKRQEFDPTED